MNDEIVFTYATCPHRDRQAVVTHPDTPTVLLCSECARTLYQRRGGAR